MVSRYTYRRWRLPLLVAFVPISVLALIAVEELLYAGFDQVNMLWLAVLIASIAADGVVAECLIYFRSVSLASVPRSAETTDTK